MSISRLTCPAPIRRRLPVVPRDHDLRDQAISCFEAQDYVAAVQLTLRYLLLDAPATDLEHQPLLLIQGTARVHGHLQAGSLVLSVVLAELDEQAHTTAALRYALSRLSATGQLFQPRLRGKLLCLEFRDQLSLLHPLKLIEVLQRMPVEADSNDAWLIDRFAVQTPDREALMPLSEDEFEQAWTLWSEHWDAMNELLLESRRRRSVRFLDTLGSLAANQIRYALPLYGPLRADLNGMADVYTDAEEHPDKRDAALAKCVRQMRKVSREKLADCLGHARYAIAPLQEGSPALLSSMLAGNRMQGTGELRASGRSLEAALELISDYCYLLAYYAWPAEVEQALRSGLDQASDKPWREATDVLWNHANSTVRAYGNHAEPSADEATPEYRYDA